MEFEGAPVHVRSAVSIELMPGLHEAAKRLKVCKSLHPVSFTEPLVLEHVTIGHSTLAQGSPWHT
jgi:hypothetical protein